MLHKTNKCTCTQDHVDKGMAYINGGYLEDEVVPTSDGLAIAMDVCRKTVYNWAEMDSNEFREQIAYIMDRVQSIQGKKIVNGGLTGDFNPAFAGKLVGNHGYGDKQTVEHSGPNGQPIKTESKVEWTIQPVKPVNEADSEG